MKFYKPVLLVGLICAMPFWGCSKGFIKGAATAAVDVAKNGGMETNCKEIRTPEDVKRFSRPTVKYLASAIKNLAIASQQIFEAADLKEDAERMALIQQKLEQNPELLEDEEKLKEIFAEVNTAMEKISRMNYEAKLNKAKAREGIALSSLHFGIAGFYDFRAQTNAAAFINCTTATANKIASNPLDAPKYAPLLGAIKDYVKFTKFVVSNVSDQVKHIKSISTGLKTYARNNNIEVPSEEELEKEKAKYAPDIDQGDLMGS